MHAHCLMVMVLALAASVHGVTLSATKKVEIQAGRKHPLLAPGAEESRYYIAPTRDGGYFLLSPEGTNGLLKRFDATNGVMWTGLLRGYNGPHALFHTRSNEFLMLNKGNADLATWIKLAGDGRVLRVVRLGTETNYSGMVEADRGFLLYGVTGPSYSQSVFVRKMTMDWEVVWERVISDCRVGSGPCYVNDPMVLPEGNDAFVAVFTGGPEACRGVQVYRVTGDGRISFLTTVGTKYDRVAAIVGGADGEYLIGMEAADPLLDTSNCYPPGRVRFGGGSDLWLVKLAANGRVQWQRTYGGAGVEYFRSALRTEDGGLLVSGLSFWSGVTGTKGVDGDGVWTLKLNAHGLKEAELLLPYAFTGSSGGQLLSAPGGYRAAGEGWIQELMLSRRIRIAAQSVGSPFKIDSSHDLVDWTNVVSRFDGTLVLEEEMQWPQKFYRAVDVP